MDILATIDAKLIEIGEAKRYLEGQEDALLELRDALNGKAPEAEREPEEEEEPVVTRVRKKPEVDWTGLMRELGRDGQTFTAMELRSKAGHTSGNNAHAACSGAVRRGALESPSKGVYRLAQ